MCWSSVRVFTESSRTVPAVDRTVAASGSPTWSAPAWRLMRLTWWATTSCISRASQARSVDRVRSARSRCSRSRPSASSRCRSRRTRAVRPRTSAPAARTQESIAMIRVSRSTASSGRSVTGYGRNCARATATAPTAPTATLRRRSARQ
ncbi:hypothetical protein SBADM41S_01101 [Streptomyces badius]